MLELILKLYSMAMATRARSPVPHLFGPPGCGKSEVVAQAAEIIGVNMWTINVSRISPLELEGVQMPVPHDVDQQLVLKLLTATFWTQLREGDILFLDEFLRGFPEVYNGLLDIITSRNVAGYQLPEVFIMAASNSIVTYDNALGDRLMHLPVPDPRKDKPHQRFLAKLLVEKLGLLPEMATTMEMQALLDNEVLPTFELLDHLQRGTASAGGTIKGNSLRKLIGMAQLRNVQSTYLAELIAMNNSQAMRGGKFQYVFFLSGNEAKAWPSYQSKAVALLGNQRLTPVQKLNLDLNLQLMELEQARQEKEVEDVNDRLDDDEPF